MAATNKSLFQTLDKKEQCARVYYNNNFIELPPDHATLTWNYSGILKNRDDITYTQLYCNGKTLDEVCPEHLRPEWEKVFAKLKAFYSAVNEAKLNLNEHCFYDMVPRHFLVDYCEIKNKITDYIFSTSEQPPNYDFLVSLNKILTEISHQKVNVDVSFLKERMHEFKVRQFIKKVNGHGEYIKYNIFGTRTGRLTTKRDSFPVLTMDKSYRGIVKPNNDWFIEFDYNAMELRVMLALLGQAQPQEDIHEWNMRNVYRGITTRDEAKKRVFAWLYNPESKDELSNDAYNRELILKKHWNGTQVNTIYDRKIDADRHHALNYIIQSTAADLFHRQMIKLYEFLEDKESSLAFCIHDSLVLDFSEKDMRDLVKLKRMFADTSLGDFLVNVSAGKHFGEMKKIKI